MRDQIKNPLIVVTILIFTLLIFHCSGVDIVKPVDNEKKLDINIFVPEFAVPSIYNVPMGLVWLNESFLSYKNPTPDGFLLIGVDPEKKVKKVLTDEPALADMISKSSGKKMNNSDILFKSIKLDDDMTVEVRGKNAKWEVNLNSGEVKELDNERTGSDWSRSPDGNYTVVVKNDNLWLEEKGREGLTQLTRDGNIDQSYDTRRFEAWYTDGRIKPTDANFNVEWSPDSSRFVASRADARNVTTLPMLEYSPADTGFPTINTIKTPLPGDQNILMLEPVIFDVKAKTKVRFGLSPVPATTISSNIIWGDEPGQGIYYLTLDRGEKNATLYSINPVTGESKALIREYSPTYYEPTLEFGGVPNIRVLSNGDIVWYSERTGWGQLYLYDKEGVLIRPLTNGTFVVRDIKGVDEEKGYIYFTAGGKEPGRDPYYQHLYRVKLDGSGLSLLTPEDAEHSVTLSPDYGYFVDTYSRTDLPPVTVLRSSDGSLVMDLEKADISVIQSKGWIPPESVKTLSSDGKTELYGLIVKPTGFDKNLRYPVIEAVYPGPFNTITPTSFPAFHDISSGYFWMAQTLADLGFVVVFLDGKGTAFRDKSFHDVSYGHMGDVGGLSDHVAGLTQLAKNRTWMDLSRVGIFGHSGGGFMTAQALLTYPDFYDVGVASSGNYDNRLYNSVFVEKYQGYPVNATSYEEQVTGLKAKNLKGQLLLITGDVDDNVNPSLTIQLASDLINANKQFDMLILPGKDHGYFFDSYYMSRMYSYFVQHLLNKDPVTYVIPTQDESLLAEYGGSFNIHVEDY